MSKAAPHLYSPNPGLQAVFGDDPGDLAEAAERMMAIWPMSDHWGAGGAAEARAGQDEEAAVMSQLAELAASLP